MNRLKIQKKIHVKPASRRRGYAISVRGCVERRRPAKTDTGRYTVNNINSGNMLIFVVVVVVILTTNDVDVIRAVQDGVHVFSGVRGTRGLNGNFENSNQLNACPRQSQSFA